MAATWSMDDETLRERPDDVQAAWSHVEELARRGATGDGERVAWLRILGDLAAAEELGWRVLERSGGPAAAAEMHAAGPPPPPPLPLGAIAPALRLAHVLQWQERFADAEALFARALRSVDALAADVEAPDRRLTLLRSFAHQHLGKCLFDQGRWQEALTAFEQARAARSRADLTGLRESSDQAIRTVRGRLAGPQP